MLDLETYLRQTSAELERRRAEAARAPVALPALPQPSRRKERVDNNRRLDRALRYMHKRQGLCLYHKCRGKNCRGGMK